MQMYPAYKMQDALDEYAVRFFALLNEGYRLRYAKYIMLAQISDLPQADQKYRKQFYKNLEYASTHSDDILKPIGESSSPADIKKLLGG